VTLIHVGAQDSVAYSGHGDRLDQSNGDSSYAS
jgi:hypothetical protein